ncbi:unnamed protein product [Rhizophagus irregularis]|nr:unnamed protein product [Rhizophagus irregularis]
MEKFDSIWVLLVVGGPDENPRNLIFGKSVDVRYVEELVNPFEDLHFEECFVSWSWIKNHCNLCQYFLDIERCTNPSCCGPHRAKEAMVFLQLICCISESIYVKIYN